MNEDPPHRWGSVLGICHEWQRTSLGWEATCELVMPPSYQPDGAGGPACRQCLCPEPTLDDRVIALIGSADAIALIALLSLAYEWGLREALQAMLPSYGDDRDLVLGAAVDYYEQKARST